MTTMQPDSPQQFCLRWNNYQTNLTSVFDQLLQSESFVDVTLACDGHSIKAHKMVLSACSPYFKQLFVDNPCQHPIVILKDVNWPELKSMVEFMYKGEINVSQDQINPLLKVAESLKIRGLADVNNDEDSSNTSSSLMERKTHRREMSSADERSTSSPLQLQKKRRRKCSPERKSLSSPDISPGPGPGDRADTPNEVSVSLAPHAPQPTPQQQQQQQQQQQLHQDVVPCPLPPAPPLPVDDLEIKPGIAEMIREEERAKLLESSHGWLGASTSTLAADSYQYQLQSMWQKCWNTNSSLVHNLRFRERGPLKSWRPETMAEAIFSVLKEGLSLSQAARKYDIPYPTFVLYANRVHNMLGPSADGGADLRPKGRGRPQRILLGVWPDEHIRGVIRTVVFRDPQHIKEDPPMAYPRIPDAPYLGNACGPPADPSTAAIAAVAHGLRQQMCNMVAAAHHHDGSLVNSLNLLSHCNSLGLPTNGMRMGSPQDLRVNSPGAREVNISPEMSPRVGVEGGAVNLSTHASPPVAGAKESGAASEKQSDDYEVNLSTRHLSGITKSPSDVYEDLDDLVPPESLVRDTPMPLKVEITE